MSSSDLRDSLVGGGAGLTPPSPPGGEGGGGVDPLRNYLLDASGHIAEFGADLERAGNRLVARNDELADEALVVGRLLQRDTAPTLATSAVMLPTNDESFAANGVAGEHLDAKLKIGRRLARTMKEEMDSLARKLRQLGRWGDLLAKLLDSVIKALEANPALAAAFEVIKELLELAAVLAEEIGKRYAGRLGRA